ncbi:MAG: GTP cyclohydrolase I FolE2 [Promethearchaeota archaeon]|nr:MAG: GTP cyclohydrolase I FolE2 [Candidatus Lokiarchaeota archaeon]
MEHQFKHDLQNSESQFPMEIDRVGIKNVKKKVDILQKNKKYSFYPMISALISLPAQQRGIHMSRTSETIEEVINEVILRPTPTIERVGDRIARRLLKRHLYTTKVEVRLEGEIIVQVRENAHGNVQKAYEISSCTFAKRKKSGDVDFKYFITANAVGMSCCPCALDMSKEYAEEIIRNRDDIEIPQETMHKLLNILPFASHNQRSKGTIKLEINDLDDHTIDILDLIDVIEESMSGRIQSVLKRPDEAELIRSAHLKPLFAEDIIREMARNFIKKDFPNLNNDFLITFEVESYESIHPHNVFAKMETTIGELRKHMAQ